METKPHFSILATSFAGGPRPRNAALILSTLWLLLFFAALFAPPILDDADATHAQAALAMLHTGDLVTLHVNGIRYLEKAPLPYWLTALSFLLFGPNTFAAHLPLAIAVALLALLGHRWANHAFGSRTAFYTAVAILTSPGVFLFTRILIPEIWLSLFLAAALYAFLRTVAPNPAAPKPPQPRSIGAPEQPQLRVPQVSNLRPGFPTFLESSVPHSSQSHRDEWAHPQPPQPPIPERPAQTFPLNPTTYPYLMWAFLALAVLSKGLVALIFFFIPITLYLLLTAESTKQALAELKLLRPLTGALLFLAIAAPWHILAAVRNPATPQHEGFLWFYFWNEHVLRFLGRRTPADFNKMPAYAYWLQHLAWLFPWTLFLPLGIAAVWRRSMHQVSLATRLQRHKRPDFVYSLVVGLPLGLAIGLLRSALRHNIDWQTYVTAVLMMALLAQVLQRHLVDMESSPFHRIDHQQRHILLLALFASTVLLFFSLSTNQEYYTFPAYLPLLLLIASTITRAEQTYSSSPSSQRWITFAHVTLTALGTLIALALLLGLWQSRNIPSSTDLGTLLAHRGIGGYTLSTSHLFDLTTPAFAALRLPAALAAFAFATGPALAWALRMQRRHLAATTTIAFTSAVFLIAAHLAFARFAPILSSRDFAQTIQHLEQTHALPAESRVMIYGDQAFGSSIPFYLNRSVDLVEGRTTSMLFGSTFPDAFPIFLTARQLQTQWSQPETILLFIPAERREEALRLLPPNPHILRDESGKLLLLNHP